MRQPIYIGILIAAISVFCVSFAEAAFYRYVDKEGAEHITNDLSQVPQEYQEQFLDKSEPEKPQADVTAGQEIIIPKAKGAGQQEAATEDYEEQEPATLFERLMSFADRHSARAGVQVVLAITAIIAIFIIGGRVGTALGHKKLAALIGFGLTALILMYLVSANLQGVSDKFNKMKGDVDRLQSKLNKRQEQMRQRADELEGQKDDIMDAQKKLQETAGQ